MWPKTQETTDLLTFTGEILNGKFQFLCSVSLEKGPILKKEKKLF